MSQTVLARVPLAPFVLAGGTRTIAGGNDAIHAGVRRHPVTKKFTDAKITRTSTNGSKPASSQPTSSSSAWTSQSNTAGDAISSCASRPSATSAAVAYQRPSACRPTRQAVHFRGRSLRLGSKSCALTYCAAALMRQGHHVEIQVALARNRRRLPWGGMGFERNHHLAR
jgi:hypothetical protein